MNAASLLLAVLLLVGASVFPLLNSDFGTLSGRRRVAGFVAVSLLLGIVLDLVVTTVSGRIGAVFVLVVPALLLAVVLHGATTARPWCTRPEFGALRLSRQLVFAFLVLAACLVALELAIAFRPIRAWDARSIWFFHAKIMFFDGGLVPESWMAPEMAFSHTDYPKLIATLAAQVAWIGGVWNEYAPLSALIVLIVLELALLAYVLDDAVELGIVLTLLALIGTAVDGESVFSALTNGYMDAHLAVLAPLALACLVRAARRGSLFDLTLGLLTLGIVTNLKNEGLPLAVFAGLLPLAWHAGSLRRVVSSSGRQLAIFVAVLALSAAPILLWTMLAGSWGLKGDLLTEGFAARVAARLDPGTVLRILDEMTLLPILAAAALAFAVRLRIRCRDAELFAAVAAAYLAVVVVMYLSSPYDLAWHLFASAERVSLAVRLLLIGATVALWRDWRRARAVTRVTPVAGAA